jgi:hypothetical protein
MPFYLGPWPTDLAQSAAEAARQYVIRVLEPVIATAPSTGLTTGNAKWHDPIDDPWPANILPRNRSVPTFEALVAALGVMPPGYVRVRVDPAGLAFDKVAPNSNTGTLNTTDPRRLTYNVIEGSARLAMFTDLKTALTTPRLKYKVSFQGAGALIVLTHQDDVEV